MPIRHSDLISGFSDLEETPVSFRLDELIFKVDLALQHVVEVGNSTNMFVERVAYSKHG